MNDAEYVFHQTSRTAKRLARGAYAKKNGCRSRKCSLPSDKLTNKELKERNGKIMSYNLSAPMDWKTFKSLDDDMQSQYIYRLVHTYHARLKDVADMFGKNPNYLSKWFTDKWGENVFPRTGQRNPHSTWLEFISPKEPEPADDHEPIEEPKVEHTPPTRVKLDIPKTSADRGCVVYTGLPAAVFERAFKILDAEDNYTVTIMFVKKKEE